jgi:hypothetical protein
LIDRESDLGERKFWRSGNMKSRKTSSVVSKSRWNLKNICLHALHAIVLVITIAAHPVRDHCLTGAMP